MKMGGRPDAVEMSIVFQQFCYGKKNGFPARNGGTQNGWDMVNLWLIYGEYIW